MKEVIKKIENLQVIDTNSISDYLEKNPNAIVVYSRTTLLQPEYAMLTCVNNHAMEKRYGFVSLIGGPDYSAAFVSKTIAGAINQAISLGKRVYVFDSIYEFVQKKDEILFGKEFKKKLIKID